MSIIGTKSINFDGVNDHILVPHASALDFNALTQSFSGVIFYRNTNYQGGWRTLFAKYDPVAGVGWAFRMNSTERLHFGLYGTGSDSRQGYANAPDHMIDLAPSWRMAAFTYDHTVGGVGGIKLYEDGNDIGLVSVADDLITSTANTAALIVGALDTTNGQYWHGNLHGCLLYNRVLTPSEIVWLFNAAGAGDPLDGAAPSGLVAYWPLGQGDTYPTASELVAANSGTMTNMDSGDIIDEAPYQSALEEPPDILAGDYPTERDVVPGKFGNLIIQMEEPPDISGGAYPIERALLFTPEEVVPDETAPVVSNFNPPLGTELSEQEPVTFDVTDDSGELRRVLVAAVFADGVAELVHDGDNFRGWYQPSSSRQIIANGFRYSVLRYGGWPTSPATFNVFAFDSSGNEAA